MKTARKYRIDFVYEVEGCQFKSQFDSHTFPTTNLGCQRMVRKLAKKHPGYYTQTGTVILFQFHNIEL